jgi:ParB/RepB/Spo0J family partition protein
MPHSSNLVEESSPWMVNPGDEAVSQPRTPISGGKDERERALLEISLDEIEDSPFQVKQYDDSRVKELADSIRRQGLLQPATVRLVNGKYELICGHARRAALRLLRDKLAAGELERTSYCTMECLLLPDIDDARAAALTAIENLQRDDGTPLEQALMVAKARAAANYAGVAETAEALGLPRSRVRQYLELAEAPLVLRHAVAPGVLIPENNFGDRKRAPLPITTVLGARAYYDFLLSNRLAELRGKATAQAKRKERNGRGAPSGEVKERDFARLQEEAHDFASEKTEQFLCRAATQGWTGAQLQAHVRSATKPQPASQSMPGGTSFPKPQQAVRLYEDTGGRLIVWPQSIANADTAERTALAEKLRILLQQLNA